MRRYLQANERSAAPQHYIAIDVETDPHPRPGGEGQTVNLFRLGVAYKWRIRDGRMSGVCAYHFTQREQMLSWLLAQGEPKARTWVFGHWIGYDLTALQFWGLIERGLLRPYKRKEREGEDDLGDGLLVIDDPPTILDLVAGDGRRQTYLDLFQWLPESLEKIGDKVGCPKLTRPGDEASAQDVMAYCDRDAFVVATAVTRIVNLIRNADLGNMRYTVSGQSVALWRHLKPTPDVLLGHDETLKQMERRSYHGMGVTTYYVGKVLPPLTFFDVEDGTNVTPRGTERTGPIYKLDVNSCYPSVMHGRPFPVQYCYSLDKPSVSDLAERLRVMEGVADVTVRSDSRTYPVKEDGEVVWAHGAFRTTLAGPELRVALEAGDVDSVQAAQIYRRGWPFNTFVQRVWHLIQHYKGKEMDLEAGILKTIGNSLHGKLGQRNNRWETVDGVCPPMDPPWGTWAELVNGESQTWRSLGGVCQILNSRGETSANFPLIASYVTSYARLLMRDLIDCAGERGVYYWDADCILTSAAGFARLSNAGRVDPNLPGCLKQVSRSTAADIRGPKNYRLDDEWVRAGVRAKAVVTETGMVWDDTVYGLKGTLGAAPPEGPLSQTVSFRLPVGKVRGVVGGDGWVKPLRVVHA